MKRPPPLTTEQRQRIKRLAKTNSRKQIAEKMKLPLSRIRRFCIKHKLVTRSPNHAPLGKIDVAAEVLELGSVQAVADKHGVSRQAIYLRING